MTGLVEKVATKLPSVYDSNQTALHKYIVLICLEKLLSYSEDEDLQRALDPSSLSLFLSKLTESNDLMVVALTLQIVEIVFQKLPLMFNHLAREGLLEFISKYSDPESSKKLEAVLVASKKALPGTNYGQGFGFGQSYGQGYMQSYGHSFGQNIGQNFQPQATLPVTNLGGTDPKYDSFMNYVQSLNQKFGSNAMPFTQAGGPGGNKFTTDASNLQPNFKSDKDRFASYIAEAKKALESKVPQGDGNYFIYICKIS